MDRLINTLAWILVLLAIACSLYVTSRVFIVDSFSIPSSSMEPTLLPGDKIYVNKLLMGARIYEDFNFSKDGVQLKCWRTKGFRKIMYNDIVVFNRSNHAGEIKFIINNVYCKRVIGLPGDTISIVNGYYKNNNYDGVLGIAGKQKELETIPDSILKKRKTLRSFPRNPNVKWTIRHFGPLYIPRKGDIVKLNPKEAAAYVTLLEWETGKKIGIDWKTGATTADGKLYAYHCFLHNYYFMAGDNVPNSNDSRYFGPVPEEYIVGIVSHYKNRKEGK